MDQHETLRRQHLDHMSALTPALVDRLDWSAERLAEHRTAGLRELLRVAVARSPWHRRRLADVDLQRVTEADLVELPAMTKDDLMAHFDEIVTDPRLTLRRVEAHLETLTGAESYLDGRYHAVASSGSSGRRGVFVWGWDTWSTAYAALLRHELRGWMGEAREPVTMATIAAGRPTHASRAIFQTFSRPELVVRGFSIAGPLEETVSGLNEMQPTVLGGYPSGLVALAREAAAGKLRIAPRRVYCFAEPLLPEMRELVEQVWSAPVCNWWCSSEMFPLAVGCGSSPQMHLSDDLVVVEPVDANGRAVATGTRSAKVLLTNLTNPTLPLIRYEVTDEVVMLDGACPCGSAHRLVADVEGRLDDSFDYAGVTVHPHVFRSPLSRSRHVLEYQVRQTPDGAEILVRAEGAPDLRPLQRDVAEALVRLGAPGHVTLVEVPGIARHASGKLPRFVPLPTVQPSLV
jgi:phenylacetate-coenzyme A ligase PaaK-like adenylate-forming protein